MFERGVDQQGFSRIVSKGDAALSGGMTTLGSAPLWQTLGRATARTRWSAGRARDWHAAQPVGRAGMSSYARPAGRRLQHRPYRGGAARRVGGGNQILPQTKVAQEDKNYTVGFYGTLLSFPDFPQKDAVAQAERYAGWLRGLLREAQFEVPVIPALALPGWAVVQSDDTWRMSTVKVFSPMGNGANFMAKDLARIEPAQRSRIAQALALRYPKIVD